MAQKEWDFFVSHTRQDRRLAANLAEELITLGYRVWLDAREILPGDSLRAKIDEGLANSRYGVLILSPAFFSRPWPLAELNALVGLDADGSQGRVIPIWHRVSVEEIKRQSPMIADRRAIQSNIGARRIAGELSRAIGGPRIAQVSELPGRYAHSFVFPEESVARAKSWITRLAEPAIWEAMSPIQDMAQDDVWMGSDSEELIECLYALYGPIVAYRCMRDALTRSSATFDLASARRRLLLEAALCALLRDDLVASSSPRLDYTPRVPGWRRLRQQNPAKYWWQGISDERLTHACSDFVEQLDPFELVGYPVFRSRYLKAFRGSPTDQQRLGLVANPLYGYSPSTRPVLTRIVQVWERLYTAYLVSSSPTTSYSDLIGALTRHEGSSLGTLEDRKSVTGYIEKFVLPTLDAVSEV